MAVTQIIKVGAAQEAPVITKQPLDKTPFLADFSDFLADRGITLSSISASTIVAGTGTPPVFGSAGNAPTLTTDNMGVTFRLEGGDGTWNGTGVGTITLTCACSNGETKSVNFLCEIKDRT